MSTFAPARATTIMAAGSKGTPKPKEQLIASYGSVQASNPFTIERDDSGEVVRLVGRATISLPTSKYMRKLDLVVSLGPDGCVGAKLQSNAFTTVRIGGLTVRGGTLTAAIDHGQLGYALDGATIALPKNIGDGALSTRATAIRLWRSTPRSTSTCPGCSRPR